MLLASRARTRAPMVGLPHTSPPTATNMMSCVSKIKRIWNETTNNLRNYCVCVCVCVCVCLCVCVCVCIYSKLLEYYPNHTTFRSTKINPDNNIIVTTNINTSYIIKHHNRRYSLTYLLLFINMLAFIHFLFSISQGKHTKFTKFYATF